MLDCTTWKFSLSCTWSLGRFVVDMKGVLSWSLNNNSSISTLYVPIQLNYYCQYLITAYIPQFGRICFASPSLVHPLSRYWYAAGANKLVGYAAANINLSWSYIYNMDAAVVKYSWPGSHCLFCISSRHSCRWAPRQSGRPPAQNRP